MYGVRTVRYLAGVFSRVLGPCLAMAVSSFAAGWLGS